MACMARLYSTYCFMDWPFFETDSARSEVYRAAIQCKYDFICVSVRFIATTKCFIDNLDSGRHDL